MSTDDISFFKVLGLTTGTGHEADNTPGLLSSATEYVQIRALSMPTSLLLGVVQAACLGAKDSVTPLIAIVYSTIVNVVGDFLLVNRLGMGLRGAAIATTFAQVSLTAMFDKGRATLQVPTLEMCNFFSGPLPRHFWVLPGSALSAIGP